MKKRYYTFDWSASKIKQLTLEAGDYIAPFYFRTRKEAKEFGKRRIIQRCNENLETIRECLEGNRRYRETLKTIEAIKV